MDKNQQRELNNSEPKTQSQLEALPRKTLAKNMRNVEDILEEAKRDDSDLTPDEERLLDLLHFEKTGKRTEKFAAKVVERVEDLPLTVGKIRGPVFLKGASSVGAGSNKKEKPVKITKGLDNPQVVSEGLQGGLDPSTI